VSKRPRQQPDEGDEREAPTESSPAPVQAHAPVERPGLEGFEQWLQKTMTVKLLMVIVVAFVFKTFVPFRIAFTLGLAVGLAGLAGAYLVDFYRRRPPN